MSEVQPQPGDKVHVVVHRPTEFDATVTSLEPGWIHLVDEEGAERSLELPGAYPSKITILERADDPSRDEVGTVAELDGVTVPLVKTGDDFWEPVGNGGLPRSNAGMVGRRVTGAVPGTPAAQTQPAPIRVPEDWMDDILSLPSYVDGDLAIDELFRLIESWLPAAKVEPLVVQYGDPEPDRTKTFHTPVNRRVKYREAHSGWSLLDGGWAVVLGIPWTSLQPSHFPLTEAVEP